MMYTVRLRQGKGDWFAKVARPCAVSAHARTFEMLNDNVRQAIAKAQGMPCEMADSLLLRWKLRSASASVTAAVRTCQRVKTKIGLPRDMEPKIINAVGILTEAGWSMSDQACLMGIPAGRVSQIARLGGWKVKGRADIRCL